MCFLLWDCLGCIFEFLCELFNLCGRCSSIYISIKVIDFVIFSDKFSMKFFAETSNYSSRKWSRKEVCNFLEIAEIFDKACCWSKAFRNCFGNFWFVFIYCNSICSRVVLIKIVKIEGIWLLVG